MKSAYARSVSIAAVMILLACSALSQEVWPGEEDHYDQQNESQAVENGTTTAPIAVPTLDDFAPVDADPAIAPDGTVSGGANKSLASSSGINTYFEVTSKQKAGLLTPYYKWSRNLKFKARIPLIYNRTLEYAAGDLSSSGIGDITLESEFKKYMAKYKGLASVQLSLKMPTGKDDVELDDNFNAKPTLGTGTWDLIAKTSFAKSTPTSGWVGSLLYRKNSSTETVTEDNFAVYKSTNTNASQVVMSGFFRRQFNANVWWALGTTLTFLGDGEWGFDSQPKGGGAATTSSGSNNQGGKLVDLYPGITYRVGAFNPFLGLRIPLITSMDVGSPDRDMALIIQFSYRPGKLAGS